MSLSVRFAEAAKKVSSGSLGNLSQNDQLDLYGVYAVVQKGTAPSEGPSAFLDPRGFAKWTAWTAESHLSKDAAMQKYTDLVERLAQGPKAGKGAGSSEAFGNKASSGFDLGTTGESEKPAQELDICYWATMGDVGSVKYCLEANGVSANYRDEDGLTPLMRAADRNEDQVVDVLVSAGAELDAVDEDGQTALHYAAYCEHADMAGLLISYGASTDIKDRDDMTAFDAATGDTLASMQKAKSGTWKRKTKPYNTLGRARQLPLNIANSKLTLLVAGVSIALAVSLVVMYRYRR